MTDRAEIERLLQMTGRTLEDLPELYPSYRCKDAVLKAGITLGMAGNMICHQSDVIELLVGALRDALEKPLTLEELKQMHGEPVWVQEMESWAIVDVNDTYKVKVYVHCIFKTACGAPTLDVEYRALTCWRRKPTDKEIAAAKEG